MADQHNSNIPSVGNQIANDIPDIKENLEFHKDAFQILFETWSDTDNSGNVLDSALGFSDGTYTYDFPTNGVAANSVIMLGIAGTTVWMYENSAPPGWKVSTNGQGTVLAVSDTSGTVTGTTDGTTADHLIDSGETFSGVEVGDTAYNTTDDTVATVTNVASGDLTLDTDIFVSGENYIVGKAYVEAGGRQSSDGSWTVAGLTKDAHTHSAGTYAAPNHTHTLTLDAEAHGSAGSTDHPTGMGNPSATAVTGNSGAQSDSAVSSDATWRPTASIGKLYDLDTA